MSGMTSMYVCIVSTCIYSTSSIPIKNPITLYHIVTTLSHLENVHMSTTPTHRQYNQGIDKICCVLTKVDTVPESEKTEN